MQGKILVIDSVATNRIMLNVKLSAAFYNVVPVESEKEALESARSERPDLILLSTDLPEGRSLELCRFLKSEPAVSTIPLIMITDKTTPAIRIRALLAGADDVLSKPLDDGLLLARIRSLLRARSTAEELRLRDGTSRALGFAEDASVFNHGGKSALFNSTESQARKLATLLEPHLDHKIRHHAIKNAMGALDKTDIPDVFVIVLDDNDPDQGLRLLADIRARASTRHCGIIVVPIAIDHRSAADALDLGANDLMPARYDPAELALRITTQIRRKHVADRLRDTVRDGLQAAVIDPLTGLYNRRYALPHLARVADNAIATEKPFSVMVADIDFFKCINDRFGHPAGDVVLTEVASRLRQNLRAIDLVARIGGEEFLIVMPATGLEEARAAARRLCREIEEVPFAVQPEANTFGQTSLIPPIDVTISIGVAIGMDPETSSSVPAENPADMVTRLLELADQALYAAKNKGRNCVRLSRPAA